MTMWPCVWYPFASRRRTFFVTTTLLAQLPLACPHPCRSCKHVALCLVPFCFNDLPSWLCNWAAVGTTYDDTPWLCAQLPLACPHPCRSCKHTALPSFPMPSLLGSKTPGVTCGAMPRTLVQCGAVWCTSQHLDQAWHHSVAHRHANHLAAGLPGTQPACTWLVGARAGGQHVQASTTHLLELLELDPVSCAMWCNVVHLAQLRRVSLPRVC